MKLKNTILDKYSPHMGSFFVHKLNEVRRKIQPLQEKIAPIQRVLTPLLKEEEELLELLKDLGLKPDASSQENSESFTAAPSSYDPNWAVVEKAEYVTKLHGFMTLSEIADVIIHYEPGLKVGDLKNNLSVSFTQDKHKMKEGKNRFERRKNADNKFEYKAK